MSIKEWSKKRMNVSFGCIFITLVFFFVIFTMVDLMLTHLTYHFTPDLFMEHEMSMIIRDYFLGGSIGFVAYSLSIFLIIGGSFYYAESLKRKYGFYPNATYSVYVILIASSVIKFLGAFTNYLHLLTL